jgi:hypothetical protein
VGTRLRRFHPVTASAVQTDWIVVLLPTALAIRPFSTKASLLITGLLVVAAFVRTADGRFRIQAGPLILLYVSSLIVLSRPDYVGPLLAFLLVGTLVVRLVTTVDARKIIGSLIDGCGLYLLVNVLGYAAGLESPATNSRIGGIVESTGFVRIIFPLTGSINIPPIVAAVYVTATVFLISEPGRLRRSMRFVFLLAALIVLVGAGTRTPMVVTALLSISVICFPFITRWIAQAATALALISAFVLPRLINMIQSAVTPLMSLAPGRDLTATGINSLNGRDNIWGRSIKYWGERVNDLQHMLFGFGVNGHYRSGASLAFREQFASVSRFPEVSATMHNSFLQQLFDGGLLGCGLLVAAVFWASTKLSSRQNDWGRWGSSATVAVAVLLLSGMTESSLVPGLVQEPYWLLVVLVGVACQAGGRPRDSGGNVIDRGYNAAAREPSSGTAPAQIN